MQDSSVLGNCCQSGRDSSLHVFVLVFVSGVVLPQVYLDLTVDKTREMLVDLRKKRSVS